MILTSFYFGMVIFGLGLFLAKSQPIERDALEVSLRCNLCFWS